MSLSARARAIVAITVSVMALIGGVAYFAVAAGQERRARSATADPSERVDLATVMGTDAYIAFRHAEDDADWGKVALVPMSDPGGPRAIANQRCERVAATRLEPVRISCLDAGTGILPNLQLRALGGPDLHELGDAGVAGIVASRTRVSPSGAAMSSTTFITGDSYQQAGQFSTRTQIYEVGADGSLDAGDSIDLEEMDVTVDGSDRRDESRNFWGVTFVDDSNFYVTMGIGSDTWLMRGDTSTRALASVAPDVECPSLSPDGTHIAFKRRLKSGDAWRFEVMDLGTMAATPLGETDSVDDQLAWLDNDTVMYAKRRAGQPPDRPAVFDVFAADIDGSPPRLLITGAESPTVVAP